MLRVMARFSFVSYASFHTGLVLRRLSFSPLVRLKFDPFGKKADLVDKSCYRIFYSFPYVPYLAGAVAFIYGAAGCLAVYLIYCSANDIYPEKMSKMQSTFAQDKLALPLGCLLIVVYLTCLGLFWRRSPETIYARFSLQNVSADPTEFVAVFRSIFFTEYAVPFKISDVSRPRTPWGASVAMDSFLFGNLKIGNRALILQPQYFDGRNDCLALMANSGAYSEDEALQFLAQSHGANSQDFYRQGVRKAAQQHVQSAKHLYRDPQATMQKFAQQMQDVKSRQEEFQRRRQKDASAGSSGKSTKRENSKEEEEKKKS